MRHADQMRVRVGGNRSKVDKLFTVFMLFQAENRKNTLFVKNNLYLYIFRRSAVKQSLIGRKVDTILHDLQIRDIQCQTRKL